MLATYRHCAVLGFFLLAFLPRAEAHRLGESSLYLDVRAPDLEGRVEINVKDIARVVPLDADADGTVSVPELSARAGEFADYLLEHIRFFVDGVQLSLQVEGHEMGRSRRGTYAVFQLAVRGLDEVPKSLEVDYSVLFAADPNHKGFLILAYNERAPQVAGGQIVSLIFTPAATRQTLDLTSSDPAVGFLEFLWLGFHHIWIGLDHILFLLALLLPAVLVRRNENWEPAPRFLQALLTVAAIVTVFTVAHSVTLSLAAFEWVQLPSRAVESVIALSIAVAALNNIFLFISERSGWIVFGFGLVHGLGLAGTLSDLGLERGRLLEPLFGFNLGVELGQVAIVAVLFPVLYVIRRCSWYIHRVLRQGSVLLMIIAIYWFVERAFVLGE